MRIAMLAPLMEAIPPRHYGGSERVVSLLTEELVRRGHHVTLFASGDSETKAELVACCARAVCGSTARSPTTSPTPSPSSTRSTAGPATST